MNHQDEKPKFFWNPCPSCQGYGKILRGPSKRRLRAEKEKKKAEGATSQRPLTSNFDICPTCTGTGLIQGDTPTPINQNYPHLAIIGGGIGGSALAVACSHRGIPFTLYERDGRFDARSQGYGLTLQQASKAIQGLGITSLPEGITSTKHIVHNQEGIIIGEWGLRKWNIVPKKEATKRRNIHIARQTLRKKILEQVTNQNNIEWGYTLRTFSEENDRWNLSFETKKGSDVQYADLIVATDGIRSTVRSHVIDQKKDTLRYLDCIVMLGICPLEKLPEHPLLDGETVFQTVNGHDRIYMMPYDSEHIMWQFSFPLSEPEARTLSTQGPERMREEVISRTLSWHSPIPEIITATLPEDITGYPVYDRPILDTKLLQDLGNITLLGDAAHPMSPFKGQGANQAILDALSLARMITTKCKDRMWQQEGLRKTLLEQFEKEMIKRTTPKVEGSAKACKILHSPAVLYEGDEPRGRGI